MKKFIVALIFTCLVSTNAPIQAQSTEYMTKSLSTTNTTTITKPKQSPKQIGDLVGNFDNKIDVVFSDIDGTITTFGKEAKCPKMSDENINAVKKLKHANLPLVLTTGRTYIEAKAVSKALGNNNSYLITSQGAEIRDPKDKLIYQDHIKYADAKNIIQCIDSIKKTHNFNSKIIIFEGKKLYATETFDLPYIWAPVEVVKSFNALGEIAPCEILIYENDNKTLKTIQAELKTNFPSYHIDLSTTFFCDVTNVTATKGNAVKILAEKLNINLKNAVVLGDAENDLTMIKAVKDSGGLAVAIGSGMEKLKENAGYIAPAVNEGGFAKTVDKILENNAFLNNK